MKSQPRQFDPEMMLTHGSDSDGDYCFFSCGMIGSCDPIFPDDWSNYDVLRVLKKAGIVKPEHDADAESCAIYVNFKSLDEGKKFIEDLNAYLQRKWDERKNFESNFWSN